jgi:hypothetical protein
MHPSTQLTGLTITGHVNSCKKGAKVAYRGGLDATVLELLKGRSRSFRSLDKLELGLAAVNAMWFRHLQCLFQLIGDLEEVLMGKSEIRNGS